MTDIELQKYVAEAAEMADAFGKAFAQASGADVEAYKHAYRESYRLLNELVRLKNARIGLKEAVFIMPEPDLDPNELHEAVFHIDRSAR